MTFAVAAAGTGGHVYPGLAVAEALVRRGVSASDVVFFGGDRMEATSVPAAGFPFIGLPLQGISRSLSPANLKVPAVVLRAMREVRRHLAERNVKAVLGMGGYVTGPVAVAARRSHVPLFLHEQNAHAGIANRFAARWAHEVFVSFPETVGLAGTAVGNPLRSAFVGFDAAALRDEAFTRYDLDPDIATLGVFGGSLGAGALNEASRSLAASWSEGPLQVVHLCGRVNVDRIESAGDSPLVTRRVVGFEDRMDLFYAAVDVAVTRAGGSLFEVAATGTPMIAVPGTFGGGHQADNAAAMERAGAAVVLLESDIGVLHDRVQALFADSDRRTQMASAALAVARPDAAVRVADAMMDAAHA
jgi:UDP-N-acetylglucosamine--N-acetylmuramyl-(pentapeptide) pyrophosphoryl-undecaprenol N-acetylglucosamine transferase